MGTLGVILKTHYACGSVIRKVFCRVLIRLTNCMNQCVKRTKMDDIKERRIEILLITTTWALVVAVCVMVFVVIMLAMR